MTGGFALVAWPVRYGETGSMGVAADAVACFARGPGLVLQIK